MKFSVLISVYDGEKPDYLSQALSSIVNQSLQASEVVLVEDGPLNDKLKDVIKSFENILPLVLLILPHNVGLASALNQGIDLCSEEIIFRADSDDINLKHRFKTQMEYLKKNPHVDVLGGQVNSFEESPEKITSSRKVPIEEQSINTFAKFFSPMNHPTVVFKKSIIKAVEGYPNFRTNQDQALWALLLNRGYRLHNLDDVLVLMRVDKKFMERRLKNRFINEHKMLKFQKKIGFIDQKIFLLMIILRWLTRLFPKKLFNLMYRVVRIFLNWHNTHKP